MATFEPAYRLTLKHEGGFSDDPSDPGGATNFGLSLRHVKEFGLEGDFDHDGDVDVDDIKGLTEGQARTWYRIHWWERYGYEAIADQDLANKVYDLAVNNGPGTAHKLLQRALSQCGFLVDQDGVIGPKTIAAANQSTMTFPGCVLRELRAGAVKRYTELAAARPELNKYLDGWVRRACA